ncbi:hypothetical protein JX265_001912 [Neoarthrinium moseri]|uniref:Rhodopsin domain-containing protein n=1 Tax=Neoarthrinium moseri TaxID=1658444 RepID=A0A9Q0AVK1_9PEZI|nr:hypothetical protein JX266_006019 [Neoarthrinium moseri]KAI1880291.1 hypothetical protein JX265_001912 [Neoarthrinium moseri]
MSALEVELWAWYALVIVVVVARLVSRTLLYGSITKLKVDDYIMLFTVVCHTVLTVGVRVLSYTPTNLIEHPEGMTFTPEEYATREFGAKMVVVVEQFQMALIWSVKACLLIMYSKLTTSLRQNLIVKLVAGYVVISFVVMEILYFAVWCRPFWHYWLVPANDIQCSWERNHMITNAFVNITSDIMIIALPMPIFLKAQLPLKRKAVLVGVFALGVFTIISAILNKAYTFGDPYGSEWIYWYIREASTAIIVANLPFTWTLLQRAFNLRSFNGKSTGNTPAANSRFRSAYGNLTSRTGGEKRNRPMGLGDLDASESQEQINDPFGIPLKIYQQNEVTVTSEEVDAKEGRSTPPGIIPNGVSFTSNGNGHPPTRARSQDDNTSGEGDFGVTTTVGRGI